MKKIVYKAGKFPIPPFWRNTLLITAGIAIGYSLPKRSELLSPSIVIIISLLIVSGFLLSALLNYRKKHADLLKEHKSHAEDEAKSEFISNISHDIRTPLNAIVGLSDLLDRHPVPLEKQKEIFKTLKASSLHLTTLINDLLDFNKLENRKIELENIPFEFNSIIEELINEYREPAAKKNIKLFVDYKHQLAKKLLGDPSRLKQTLSNLMDNVLRFTESGTVNISLDYRVIKEDKILLHIDISSSNNVTPEEKINDIFNKFLSSDISVTRKYGNACLKFALSKKLIETMGGNIEGNDNNSLSVHLPITTDSNPASVYPIFNSNQQNKIIPAETTMPATIAKAVSSKNKGHILIVEDYQPSIKLAKIMLNNLGFSCDVVNNGLKALEIMKEKDFDLVLMDIQMPEMDGFTTTQKWREIEPTGKKLRIIGLTANVYPNDRQRCQDSGMDDYTKKPATSGEMEHLIKKYFPKHSATGS